MPEDPQGPPKHRTRVWLTLAAVALILVLVFLPPLISLKHYKTRITQLVAASLGRPVRLSAVELRLLPRPGFLLSDLTVQSDPEFGAEPVLHANTVTASIRFSSLWQGKLQISRISVDEASLNLVHMPDGRWNLDSLFRNAAAGPATHAPQPPYMEATNSRINIKNGNEKLPFSVLDADASMWRESNGDWRIRLRGQPARTDVSLDLADTGIVRVEATLHPAAQLNQMPLHLDLDWREAQLGQLTRLLLASDEGWRGDLTGELHLDGTAASAQVTSRLRASGVHRAEFSPAAPIDFDAACAFIYHYNRRSLQHLACDSPVGDGRARLTGEIPGAQPPRLTVELDRIPAQAALDVLRTMRSRIDPSLQATGTVSGHMTYDPGSSAQAQESAGKQASAAAKASLRGSQRGGKPSRSARPHPAPGPLIGAFTVTGLRISGDALSKPIQAASMSLSPAPAEAGQPSALSTSIEVPAGGPVPLTVTARLALASFQMGVHGEAALPRLREFAHIAGSPAETALSQLAGEPASIDFTADGPWLPPVDVPAEAAIAGAPPGVTVQPSLRSSGTVSLHQANWKAGFLTNPVLIPAAIMHLENGSLRWDPVEFSYGPVKGTATVELSAECAVAEGCPPKFTVHFGALDVAALQSALLGAHESGTLLSTLLARLTPNSSPAWPRLDGAAQADSLDVGPFTLTHVSAEVRVLSTGAEISSLDGALLGGQLHGTASLVTGDKPAYKLDGVFTGVKPALVGPLLAMRWTGGEISGSGHVEFSGYTDKDLSASAHGSLHFDWSHGSIASPPVITFAFVTAPATTARNHGPAARESGIPAALAHFDRFTGDATVANGALTLGQNEIHRGGRKSTVQATITFAIPAKVTFPAPEEPLPAKH
ncbi:MAG TPA: AsmA family protein [Terracidiphilus sp.]|jgi:hypothetical protein|nr:AsmA family protein [Terracidiphilus sp.]